MGMHAMAAVMTLASAAAIALSGAALVRAQEPPPEFLGDVLVAARTSPESLTVGDHATLEITVQAPVEVRVAFPRVPKPGDAVEVQDVKVTEPTSGATPATWTARYTLGVYQVGDVVLPPWPIEVRRGTAAAVTATDSIRFFVQSVLDDSLAAADVRDIKPQAVFPTDWLPYILGGAVALALIAGLVWWLRRRRRPRAAVVPLVRQRPANDVALEALRVLEAKQLPLDGKFVEHFVALSDILRRYFEDGFGVAALEETTEEILYDLERHGFDRSTIARVRALCEPADLVKFAKREPTIQECMASLQETRDFILTTASRLRHVEPEPVAEAAAASGGGTP
jgi:hypothetical protein